LAVTATLKTEVWIMSSIRVLSAALVAVIATTGSASAASTKQVDRTKGAQSYAIDQARMRGDLTKREKRQLVREQDRIAAMVRHARADGKVTNRELREIQAAQRDARVNIASEASDGQKSWLRRWLYKTR
jgi:uncharacterized membrane protein YebE (DUF533 family)